MKYSSKLLNQTQLPVLHFIQQLEHVTTKIPYNTRNTNMILSSSRYVFEDGECDYHMNFNLDPLFQGQIHIFAHILIKKLQIESCF